MQALYLIKYTRNRDLTMKGITQQTDITKSTLQRILPRLEKRGWIERYETFDPEKTTILWGTRNFSYKETLKKAKGSYESRRNYAKQEWNKAYLPKKIIAYKILNFPFLAGNEEGVAVPKGYAQRWLKASKESKQAIEEYRESWRKDKKLMEGKRKSIERQIKRFNPRIYNPEDYTSQDIADMRKHLEIDLTDLKKELTIHQRKGIMAMRYEPIRPT